MQLLDDTTLERSPIVANSRMNRERRCVGTNSYAQELGVNPLDFLAARLEEQLDVAWLDLCCGSGRALFEAAGILRAACQLSRVRLIGVDLVDMFAGDATQPDGPQLVAASLSNWQPAIPFDLITCVHGLHYLGDKLAVLQRAVSWLKPQGLFLAHLDLKNLRLTAKRSLGCAVLRDLRAAGIDYQPGRRLLRCNGPRDLRLDYEYLGADDAAGPNFTGQEAVHSYYRRDEPASCSSHP